MGYYWGKEDEEQPYTAADGDKGENKTANEAATGTLGSHTGLRQGRKG